MYVSSFHNFLLLGEEFKYKKELMLAIESLNLSNMELEIPQTMILGVRIMLSWKLYGTIPKNEMYKGTEEDEYFMHMMLSYYS